MNHNKPESIMSVVRYLSINDQSICVLAVDDPMNPTQYTIRVRARAMPPVAGATLTDPSGMGPDGGPFCAVYKYTSGGPVLVCGPDEPPNSAPGQIMAPWAGHANYYQKVDNVYIGGAPTEVLYAKVWAFWYVPRIDDPPVLTADLTLGTAADCV